MSTQHPQDSELEAFLRGRLSGADMLRVGSHVASCPQCNAAAARLAGPATSDLVGQMAAPLHEIAGRDAAGLLTDFAAGATSPAETAAVEAHLRTCESCASTVAALTRPRRRTRAWLAYAAAAVVLIIAAALLFRRANEPVPVQRREVRAVPVAPRATPREAPRAARNDEWQRIVDMVIRDGRLVPPPVLADVWIASETQRSLAASAASALSPAGEVIENARPVFRWLAVSGARYVVHLYDGEREVARSPEVRVNEWRPPHELRRGRTYSWELAIHENDSVRSLPEPPDPPARFHVLSAERAAELERARESAPRDHLLLGILYARAGLRREALAELERATAGGDVHARELLDSVRAWRPYS